MKIALIGCTVNPRVGGMGRALYDHAAALAEAGQEVVVYTLDAPHPNPLPRGERELNLQFGKLKSLLHIGKAAWGVRFDPPLDSFDVVHLHLPFFGVAERVARWKMSFRASGASREISSLRSLDSGSRRASARDDRKQLFITYHMDAIGTGLKRLYFNWWYRHRFKKVLAACDAIAVTSRAYARDSQLARAGIDVEKCEEILLRVDTDVFNPTAAQWHARLRSVSEPERAWCPAEGGTSEGSLTGRASAGPGEIRRAAGTLGQPTRVSEAGVPRAASSIDLYLLFVGALDRAHYFKGLSLLLRVFRSLDPGSPPGAASGMTGGETASGMTLVVVGAGELLDDYKKEAARLGIADRVHFTGGVSDEELACWYSDARALVLPSTDRSEAFGIVLIEAMACGTPVIASDLPGVHAVVERVKGGALVSPSPCPGPALARPVRDPSPPRGEGNLSANLIAALQQIWQHPWSDDERAVLAARTALTYGRATLADQLLQWYTTVHVSSR